MIEWDNREMPFKDGDATARESYHISDTDSMEDSVDRIKRILDAKYEKADLSKICQEQSELDDSSEETT